VKAAHARRIREDIGVAYEMIDERGLCAPIVGEASEVRDNECDVGIFFGQHFRHGHLAHHVIEDWHAIAARGFANFARDPAVVTVELDAYEPEIADALADDGIDAPLVGKRMKKGEAEKPLGIARNDSGDLSVGAKIALRERGKYDGPIDARGARALEIVV